jgi:hypothetical protein
VTNYTLNNTDTKSTTGEITSRSNSFNSSYTKAIPVGRLTAGLNLTRSDSERMGTLSIINEVYSAALLGTFSLTQSNITESSIVVSVIDPGTKGLTLLPQSDYQVNRVGEHLEITIISVSSITPQTDPSYLYEFHVSYALSSQSNQSESVRDTWGYSLKLDLLENLLSVYYNYSTSDLKVLSGALAGGAGRDSTDTVGLTVQSERYSGLLEHQRIRSWQNPSESLKATGQYHAPLVKDANISSLLSYQQIDYFASSASAGMRQKRFGVNLMLDRKLPHENMNFFMTSSYDRSKSFVNVDTFSVNTYLTWQIGLLSLNGGVQMSRSESTLSTGKVILASEYYYVTVTRKLF